MVFMGIVAVLALFNYVLFRRVRLNESLHMWFGCCSDEDQRFEKPEERDGADGGDGDGDGGDADDGEGGCHD
jgi:hypothetical protein